MTKEQEAMKTLYKDLKLAKKEDSIDIDVLTVNLETVLNMLKEKDELHHKALGDLAKADRENIKKDKQIDLMTKAMDKIQDPQVCKYCDNKINLNNGYCVDARKCKEGIKQYFERKSEEC